MTSDGTVRSGWSNPVSRASASGPPRPPAAPVALTPPKPPPAPAPPANRFRRTFFQGQAVWASLIAWSVSMVTHLVLLVLLGLMLAEKVREQQAVHEFQVTDTAEEQISEFLEQNVQITETTERSASSAVMAASGEAGGGVAGAIAGVAQPTLDGKVMAETNQLAPTVGLADTALYDVGFKRFTEEVPLGTKGDGAAIVDSYAEVMDRLAEEILLMLAKSKVTVVWLFDQSNSMKDDQDEIRQRITTIYQQLGIFGKDRNADLLTGVASYGQGYQVHCRPTADLEVVRSAIRVVPVDESGLENTCSAIQAVCTQFGSTLGKNHRLVVVLVSDESGEHEDNLAHLESALAAAKAAKARVYSIGREAVFGYPYAHIRWVHAATKLHFWQRINRGPESAMIEALQTDGLWTRHDAHNAGFGPYDQVRLCWETGGVFFMLPSLETNLVRGERRRYELEAIRSYMPDLRSRAEYIQERDSRDFRRLMFGVIMLLSPYRDARVNLQHRFPIRGPQLARDIQTQLEKARILVTIYHEAEKEMERLKTQRDQETSPRWRANYDLMFAQVLSYKVRVYEYGAFLESFVKNPTLPTDGKSTHWEIATRRETLTGDLTRGYIERSNGLFDQIVKDHPGTPHAARAVWEKSRGYGVHFVEYYHDPRYESLNIQVPKF